MANNYLTAIEGVREMIHPGNAPLDDFNRNGYAGAFDSFYSKYVPVFTAIEELYTTVGAPDDMLDNMASALADEACGILENSKKREKEITMMNLNLSMAVFIFPSILKYDGSCAAPLVKALQLHWKNRFPKSNISAADYATIEKGFHKKFCYITTAVCETFSKPDDCYELNTFREYRDNYLMSLPEGADLIRQYYDVAPSIVKHIDERSDRSLVYRGIWDTYLSPCLTMIEQGRNDDCRALYTDMVLTLKDKYFYLNR